MGTLSMISGQQHSKDLSFAGLMSLKSRSRDRQVDAVYSSAPEMLEMAAVSAKAALRSSSTLLPRPQRFSALSD